MTNCPVTEGMTHDHRPMCSLNRAEQDMNRDMHYKWAWPIIAHVAGGANMGFGCSTSDKTGIPRIS